MLSDSRCNRCSCHCIRLRRSRCTHGNTTLLPWDRILCLTQDDTLHLLMDAWGLSGK